MTDTWISAVANGWTPTLIPTGLYDAAVANATYEQTSTGKPMFRITFEVTEGEFARRRVWENVVVTTDNPDAQAVLSRHLSALGITQAFLAEPGRTGDDIADAMRGAMVRLAIGQRRDPNGVERNDVTDFRAAAPVAVEQPKRPRRKTA
jgi:hypothetical protein